MSAFMVSKDHIDAMVAVMAQGPRDKFCTVQRWEDSMRWADVLPNGYTDKDLNELGDLLVRENLSSIHARYPDTITEPENTPGPIDNYFLKPYTFRHPKRIPTIVEAFKLIACYEYQSCEHPEWKESRAYRICQRLKNNLPDVMPGYEQAPWEWDEAHV